MATAVSRERAMHARGAPTENNLHAQKCCSAEQRLDPGRDTEGVRERERERYIYIYIKKDKGKEREREIYQKNTIPKNE